MSEEHTIDTGKGSFSLDELGPLLPGVSELMPKIGARMWRCFYAGMARNKPLARFELKEAVNLLQKCAFLEPRYADQMENFLEEELTWVSEIIEDEEWDRFEEAFRRMVNRANVYHHLFERPFLWWKIPDEPPPDLDVTPRA